MLFVSHHRRLGYALLSLLASTLPAAAFASTLTVAPSTLTLTNYTVSGTSIKLTSTSSIGTAVLPSFSGDTGTYTIEIVGEETTSNGGDLITLIVGSTTSSLH